MKRILAVIAIASISASSGTAIAQDDLFDIIARSAQVEKQNSMNSSELKGKGTNGITEKDLSDNATDPNKNCTSGTCPGAEVIPVLPRGTKKRSLTTNGPMRTHAEATSSMAYVNQDFSYLSMPWIIKEITMGYLDMGVFGGQNSGYQKASGAVQIRVASENRLLQQAALNPEIRDVAVTGYIGCVAKAQNNGASYTVASDQCMEDAANPTAGAFASNGTGTANWLQSHPEHGSGAGTTSDTIMLTDMLVLASTDPAADGYKQSFKRIFGDMRIYNQALTRGAPKGFDYTIEPPLLTPAAHDKELHQAVWVKLHELMRGYCEYWQSHMNVTPSSHKPFDFQIIGYGPWGIPFWTPVKTSFWGNRDSSGNAIMYNGAPGPDASTFIDLTTTSFEFSPEVGDALFAMFLKTQDVKQASDRQGSLNCDALKSGPGQPSDYYELSQDSSKNALEWRVLYDRAVNLIARGKRYEIYQAGRAWVDERTDGSENSDTRDKAYMLIRSVISKDPDKRQETLEAQALAFKQELAKIQQSQVGVLGHSLAGVYADGPSKNLSGGAGKGS